MSQFRVEQGELVVANQRPSTGRPRRQHPLLHLRPRPAAPARRRATRRIAARGEAALRDESQPHARGVVGLMAGLVDGIDVAAAGELKVAPVGGLAYAAQRGIEIPAMRIVVDLSQERPMRALNTSGQSGNGQSGGPPLRRWHTGLVAGRYQSFPFRNFEMEFMRHLNGTVAQASVELMTSTRCHRCRANSC
jgi:hypothetical protein